MDQEAETFKRITSLTELTHEGCYLAVAAEAFKAKDPDRNKLPKNIFSKLQSTTSRGSLQPQSMTPRGSTAQATHKTSQSVGGFTFNKESIMEEGSGEKDPRRSPRSVKSPSILKKAVVLPKPAWNDRSHVTTTKPFKRDSPRTM